jgi:hypothetical protein
MSGGDIFLLLFGLLLPTWCFIFPVSSRRGRWDLPE